MYELFMRKYDHTKKSLAWNPPNFRIVINLIVRMN